MSGSIKFDRALAAGIVGTILMTVVGVYGGPLMGLPPMNPANMLAAAMGGVTLLGWAGHFTIGIVLAVGYTLVGARLPGPFWLRGAVYGIAPFLLAQIAVMPMMGMPLFSGSAAMAAGSLVGHLVYGAAVGAVYGDFEAPSPAGA